MTTVLYIAKGRIYNDVYTTEAGALSSFGLYATATILDVVSGELTGRDMRRLAKENRVKIGR